MHLDQIDDTIPLEGDMAEVGVWKGETSRDIHSKAPLKVLHLYDTFKGIVMADKDVDVHGNGEFSNTSIEEVKGNIGGDGSLIKFHIGTFPDTFTEHDKKFSFVFSDTDTYFGTKSTLEIFASRMVPGGKITFHDYGWHGCPGVKKAVQEFLIDKTLKTMLKDTLFTITF